MVKLPASSLTRQTGFTYLLLIVAVSLLAVGLASVGTLTSAAVRHSKLKQLEWVGNQYAKAIADYYQSSPGTPNVYPQSLDDLIEDKRYLSIRRHLREPYSDPATDVYDWVPIKAPDGGIMGVQSQAAESLPVMRFTYFPPSVPNGNMR